MQLTIDSEVGLVRSRNGTLHRDRGLTTTGKRLTGCGQSLFHAEERHVTTFRSDELCRNCFTDDDDIENEVQPA